mgnify:CR=1 FL=1
MKLITWIIAYILFFVLALLLLQKSVLYSPPDLSFSFPVARNIPYILIKIAECESGGQHFNPDGSIKRGIVNPKDVGLYQINEFYHLETAQKMGINLYTEEGNIKYALYLYRKNGTRDWNWSRSCWNKAETSS